MTNEPTIQELYTTLNPTVTAFSAIITPEIENPTVTAPVELPPIRVRIYQKENETNPTVECSRPLPGLGAVGQQLSATFQKKIKYHVDYGRELIETIRRTAHFIPLQTWADAIGAALHVQEANAGGGTYEATALSEPAYLAMGDTLFRLSPVEQIKTGKALAAAKKRAAEKAEIFIKNKLKTATDAAEKMLSEAKINSDALIHSANNIRREAEQFRARAQRETPPPAWAVENHLPLKRENDMWYVDFTIQFAIQGFDVGFSPANAPFSVKQFHWDAVPQPPIPVHLWVRIQPDGAYGISGIHIAQDFPDLPHIDHSAACMELGDAPRQIRNYNDLLALADSVERCMTGVQLDSLRTYLGSWMPTFRASFPAELAETLSRDGRYDYRNAIALAKRLDAATPVPVERGEETWTA